MSYVYIESDRYYDEKAGCTKILYTVGHYDPKGEFISESDHNTPEAAAERVHYLNGGEHNSKVTITVDGAGQGLDASVRRFVEAHKDDFK